MIYALVLSVVNLAAFFSLVKVNRFLLLFLSLLVILTLVLFSGARYQTGNDWGNYTLFFERLRVNSYSDLFDQKFEFGYTLINYFVKLAGLDVGYVFLLSSFISVFILVAGLRRYNIVIVFALLFYMRYSFLQTNFMFVRQGISLSIFFYAIQFIVDKKAYKYFFLIAVACFFHISSLVLLPLYFFVNYRFNRFHYLFFLFFSLILMKLKFYGLLIQLLPFEALRGVAIAYMESDAWGRPSAFGFSSIERLVIVSFGYYIIFFSKYKDRVNQEFVVFFNIYFFGFLVYIVFFDVYVFAERFSIFFNVCAIYLLAFYVRFFRGFFSKLIFFILGSLLVWGFYLKTVFSGGSDSVFLPYQNFLF
ncbi:EpsG family protein [Marinomonas sp. FW-1]|uniref:EpsG family protein n=1 Tax=Marinomonas sp. FW-1 TaxID=2071621 RepID=UPI0010C0E4BF|nr:EpsG family protein [Marinomonas sp. FW-1]